MKFETGVHRLESFDLKETWQQAEQAGFFVFVLPLSGVVDKGSFFSAVRFALPLDPPLVGSYSWDALSDSLWEGLHVHPARRIAILWPNAGVMENCAPSEFEMALNVLADVVALLVDSQATRESPKEIVVLVG